jgi:hypothetical protein
MYLAFLAHDAPATEPQLPSCHFEETVPITFSGSPVPDKLLVSVHGDPCWKGVARITITTAEARPLYTHEQEFKPLTSSAWNDPELPTDAERFVRGTIENGKKLSKLPAWQPPDAYYEEYFTSVAVSREYYEALRSMDLPVFYHQTYYEGGVDLVYDPTCRRVVVVTQGGL